MRYRKFGKLDWKASALGFGCMRLPLAGEGKEDIDEPLATGMLHHAIDHGVNYLDTAYGYHGGQSERFLGRALAGGYREKIKLATKLPSWEVRKASDFDRLLDEQLGRLQTGHVDFYLLHNLNSAQWPKLHGLGVLEWAEGSIADGRIGHLGFSFHDNLDVFKGIIDAYDNWTLCQIQYNYMDVDTQAGTEGLEYAAVRGLAVVIMEPLRGGKLASPPPAVQAIWEAAGTGRTPVDGALQWLWNRPEVSVVLSGMSTVQQVEENVASAGASGVGTLGAEDLALIERMRKGYQVLGQLVPCTNCRYCVPCPNGVDIPLNFQIYNDGLMYEREKPTNARFWYRWMVEGQEGCAEQENGQAANCIQCGECEEKCPQAIPIGGWMPVVHRVLGEEKGYDECPLP